MRIAALGLVAAIAGCNQIWGNDPVSRWDAPQGEGPPEAALPTARLELLVATTTTSGAATNMVELRAISPAPTVQIGRVDGALTPATYDNGAISIPADFPGTLWRLVYTLAGDVPRELHWSPADGEGRAVVPQFGGVDRGAVPANASYSLTPTNAPAGYSDLRVYTTGVWGVGQPSASGSTATQPMNPTEMKVFTGSLLAPDPAKGDRVVLVNYAGTYPCQAAIGGAVFQIELTGPSSMPTAAPPYVAVGTGVTVTGDTIQAHARLAALFGVPSGQVLALVMFGYGASTAMPGFVAHPFNAPTWGPALIPLVRCLRDVTSTDAFVLPPMDAAVLPRVAHAQLFVLQGLPSGAATYSGLSGVVAATAPTQDVFTVDLPAGMPTNIKLGTTNLLDAHRVTLAGSSPTLDLTFELDNGMHDYATATLYRANTSTLVREREYTFTGTKLTIDRGVLSPQTEYVLELRTYLGAPGAAAGDFTRYTGAQSSATRFTRTFVTP
ncbi:MAG: hypothetical protein SFX73_11965 [Kofleriaceae bacterium]|nr:hypothetical protein [Kofleriaceae bacterium]